MLQIFLKKTDAWSIVEYLLDQTNRADSLTIGSFAIAEVFARKLIRARNKIEHLTLIIDMTIANRHRANLLFLSQIADEIYLTNTHAKFISLVSEEFSGVAVMSANATRNYRYECGFITDDKTLVNTLNLDIKKLKANAIKNK